MPKANRADVRDLNFCRAEFNALRTSVGGRPAVFLDGPGGTQVPRRVVSAISEYLVWKNANAHGAFPTSQATDETVESARRAMADLLGATPDEIAFGANMTTLNFMLARTIARGLGPGDEVVITELDHEANRAPWLALEERGVVVRQVRVDPGTCALDLADFEAQVGPRTRVVACGLASNAVGTVNDLARVRKLAAAVGALLVVDAVHYVPHLPVDVAAIGCDFLLCSAYKFFGPHVGVLYGRREAFEALRAYKVEPQLDAIPQRVETGTPNFEGLAGVAAAVEFIASLGAGRPASGREADLGGMAALAAWEAPLLERLWEGLASVPGVRLYGQPPDARPGRAPTLAFTLGELDAAEVARRLAARGIFVWDGDFYATTLVRRLGLAGRGGLVRMGLAPYNTPEEMDEAVAAVREMAL